jgi:p21-activated kinase 1
MEISAADTPSIKPASFITDFPSPNKRPEITAPHDPLHLMHVGPDPPIRRFIGLPEDWQRVLENSGISKSDQEKTVMEIVKFYLEGGGDVQVWDRMGHAPTPGSSRPPPIPGAAQADHFGVPKSVDSFIPTVKRISLWFPTTIL